MPASDRESFDHELIERWLNGWVLSRRVAPPVRVDGAYRVELGLLDRTFEFVTADDSSTTVTAAADAALGMRGRNWVTVVGQDPEATAASLRGSGLSVESPTEWFMTIDLARHPLVDLPAPYRLHLREEGGATVASVVDPLGGIAATGRVGVSGTDAVPDKIETSPQHRRRGLGAAVMSALAAAAIQRGARTGILAASSDGERLYRRLGWSTVARIVIGRTAASA